MVSESAVLVGSRPADDGQDAVTVTHRVGQPLEQHHARNPRSARTRRPPTSNARHRPFGDNMPCAEADAVTDGVSITIAAPASASSLSPSLRLRHARWTVSSPVEHAVSTVIDGPRTPSV